MAKQVGEVNEQENESEWELHMNPTSLLLLENVLKKKQQQVSTVNFVLLLLPIVFSFLFAFLSRYQNNIHIYFFEQARKSAAAAAAAAAVQQCSSSSYEYAITTVTIHSAKYAASFLS